MTPDQTPKPLNPLEAWLFSIAAKKVTLGVSKFATAILATAAVQSALTKYGITVDSNVFVPAMATGAMAILELAHDFVKLKTGWTWL